MYKFHQRRKKEKKDINFACNHPFLTHREEQNFKQN
jgi:hypothetical protein